MADSKRYCKKINLKRVLVIGLISILIGTFSMFLLEGNFTLDIEALLTNAGYSLMIGYGLFANGYVVALASKKWISWLKWPIRSLFIAFAVTTAYSTLVIFFTNWFWYTLIMDVPWGKFLIFGRKILIIQYVLLYIITLFFYALNFFKEWRQSILAKEELKQEAISLQYKVLSNQVNPHFLFNSLNVLSSLIRIDTDRAENFVNKLSGFYRNLLSFRGKEIILVQEEISFVNQYLDLQKERFGENIEINIDIEAVNNHRIIPMTLQMLVENAIKHNQINKENKLKIGICAEDYYIAVTNTNTPYLNPVDGERLGLRNLKERYNFLTDHPMLIEETENKFTVKVPLLKLE